MQNTETLLKATLNRLSARLGEKVIDAAAEIALIAKEAPDQLKKEWDLLKEEIIKEAERLEHENNHEDFKDNSYNNQPSQNKPLEKIDQIRSKIVDINQTIDCKD
tara:strand:+ start:116 stop:430 length:315 start_codon:yes stop_codon:yes gene_type:complete